MSNSPIETYIEEAGELLAEIEQCALSLDGSGNEQESIHQLFRAFHTLKGSGAMCGLETIAGFTHRVESLLDQVRNGSVEISRELADVILKSKDHIGLLLAAEQGGAAVAPAATEVLAEAIARLSAAPGAASPAGPRGASAPAPAQAESGDATWRIEFRPYPELLLYGGNPAALFGDLCELGECEVEAHTGAIPPLDQMVADHCYLWWTITLRTGAAENQIRDVFIFVEEGSTLRFEREATGASTAAAPAETEAGASPAAAGEKAAQTASKTRNLGAESTVRVPSERLDRLVNLVGELVMNQSRLAQAVLHANSPEFANPVQELERLVAELRDDVLGIRMLPIGTLFGRFRRLVRDLSQELGKDVALVTEGAETEIDKSILDQLGEPLVHCLRNCLDHGLEAGAERERVGKPRQGTIRLSAHHAGSDVVISIQDDGRGIDVEAVRAKAIERQLVAPDAKLSDKDIVNLILLPGFSTARAVTSVSGRGVGMDAIKRQIDALRGTLSITSEPGHGTRVSINLPLTLAIIDGLLVEIARQQYIVPMAAVTENVELTAVERSRNNGRNVIAVRGELTPYIDLRQTLRLGGAAPAVEKVIIVHHEGDRVGLVVDRVVGAHQTVIQSLGRLFRSVEVVSGATIMGDGTVALIMDIAAMVRYADRQCRKPSEQLEPALA